MRDLNRDWALRLAEAGIATFPCNSDKKPLVKWRTESSCDPEAVAQWWSEFPNALPGIDLEKSDLVVLDGDRHGGPDGRAALRHLLLQQTGFSLRSTPSVLTPGDGVHCYFKRNGHALTNSRGQLPEGIDVRGIGGYVIAYAVLPDERRYRAVPNTPDLIAAFQSGSIPHVPQGIVDLIKARKDNSEQPRPKQAVSASTGGIREISWAEAALNGAAGELAKCPAGGRNEALNAIAYRMGRMIARGWLDRADVETALTSGMRANGYIGEEGIKRVEETLKNGLDAGIAEPHPDLAEREARTQRKAGGDKASNNREQQQNTGGNIESAPASSFKMAGLNWLWPNRFALGKLGLIAGLPDRGKGLITSDMAARITTGDLWPCGEGRALKGRVLILSAEDDVEDTIVPRLAAAGADLAQVEILRMVRQGEGKRMFSLVSDLELLRRKVDELGDVVMIDIDPMSAYLGVGKIDSYRTTDVRGVLAPLTEFAAAKQVFVLGVLHFNKKTDVNNAMLRISDSLAFAATARHAYVVVDDPENDRRLFVKAKNNLAPDTKALSYGVNAVNVGNDEKTGKPIWAPRVVWGLEHVEITATQAMDAEAAGKSSSNPRAAAKTFLADLLAAGPVAKHEIEEAASANCIAVATLRRAKDDLGIIAKKAGLKDGWTWQLPEQQKPRSYDEND